MAASFDIPDQRERSAALDPEKSFIVQAPAGSGKTTLLAMRYIELLSYVSAPEEILAITFTKKAANEMKARVLELLNTEGAPQDELEIAMRLETGRYSEILIA